METNRGFKLARVCSSIQKPTVKKQAQLHNLGSLWSKFSWFVISIRKSILNWPVRIWAREKEKKSPSNATCLLVNNEESTEKGKCYSIKTDSQTLLKDFNSYLYIHPICYGSTQCLGTPGLTQDNSDSIFVYLTPLRVTTDVRGNEQGRVEGHP